MRPHEAIQDKSQEAVYPTSYHEEMIGDTLYRITSVFKGEINLKDTLEELAVRRAVREALSGTDSL